ncbi:elongation factor G [Pseudoflavonifractor sp. MCC625]|uniref:elongation factor G n=1 Tax=Pseudoflavonifractor sp. MCC625 TaxID=2592647 RepID=UPI001C02BB7D|nr:elongation factor G [Pseudoflavonifractor sp. MCC625]MBT9683624.1 elongation factor G [Pseudoflavonifractor sp. MCC625]
MSYSAQNIRNICLLGHGASGKTTLAENMLFLTGGTIRMGSPADGNTVCDFDPEEIRRQVSISTAVAPVDYKGCKINVLDTPGYFDFSGEVMEALSVSGAAVIVTPSKAGPLSVGTEKAWNYCEERHMPRILYISKTDEENADYNAAFATLRERFGKNVAPVVAPIWDENKKVIGIIDVLHKRAYEMQGDKRVEIEVPEDKLPVLDELYDALKESVAETSEEFMDKYFSGEDFTYAEMLQGLRQGVRDLSLFPVVCGSAVQGLGTLMLLDTVVDLIPNPLEGSAELVENADGELEEYVLSDRAYPCAFVFKTTSDQYGKYSYVKVMSGNLTPDMTLVNARTGENIKLGRLYIMKGKKAEEVKELVCGDIGAISKMEALKTGDTICDARKVVKFPALPFPEPCYSVAIAPKTRGQEDKIAAGLTRLNDEDLTFNWSNNAETRQMVVSGTGDMQMDVLLSKLKNRFSVEAELSIPRVAYREKIRKKVEVQGRHKKQSGGHGQFGDVKIRFEPGEQEELEFCEEVFGGAVPKNYFPAVEKGLREAVQHGVLAGYPVVNLKATLYDGSYHPVDSSEMAFKTAAQLAYKAGLPDANPTILEPIGELKVTIPDSYMGDIIGDLNKRRGRVMGMNPDGKGNQVVEAEVPMAEMMTYAIDLRSLTQSRGSFTFHFVRYEEAPPVAQQKAIEAAKAIQELDN